MGTTDKDKHIAELQERVEQLERGQSFWTSTISNALGGVISVVVVAVAAALWNNPELFGWLTVPRLISGAGVVVGVSSMAAVIYFAVKTIQLGWDEWDRRMRFWFLNLVISEIGSWVLVGLLFYLVLRQD